MKILFPVRADAIDKPGGDIAQLDQYIRAIHRAGFKGSIDPDPFCDMSQADIVHLSNLDRPLETFWFYRRAGRAGKPVVLSPIHHPHGAIRQFERLGRTSWKFRLLNRLLSYQAGEMVKSAIRVVKNPRLFRPMLTLCLTGFTAAQKKLLAADACILISRKEEMDISADFGYALHNRIIIHNSLDPAILDQIRQKKSENLPRDIDFLCVGRIEPRKNQLAILRAAEPRKLAVTFVGAINLSERKYIETFKEEISRSKSSYLGPKSREEVIDLMCRAKVHVSASWFEVSSFVDIEAHVSGAFVISSKHGATSEVIGETAMTTVNPYDYSEIAEKMAEAVEKARSIEESDAAKKPVSPDWIEPLLECYRNLLINSA